MKAIKIASGVAVTALAAAIAGQAAAADTETEYSFTGVMKAGVVFDLEGETRDVDLLESNESSDNDVDDGEAWGVDMNIAITHGPFSGSLGLEKNDHSDPVVSAGDIVVTDGAVSFGQVGKVNLTDEYITSEEADMAETAYGVDAGIRYTTGDLKVQLEGTDETSALGDKIDFGLGASYHADLGTAMVDADVQYRDNGNVGGETVSGTHIGLGVSADLGMATLKAAFNTDSGDLATEDTEFGVKADVNINDNTSAYGVVLDNSTETDDGLEIEIGASMSMDAITVSGWYFNDGMDDSGDIAFAKVAYSQDAIGAYAEVKLTNLDAEEADDAEIGLGASLTKDNGVVYAADYDMQADITSKLELSASYSF